MNNDFLNLEIQKDEQKFTEFMAGLESVCLHTQAMLADMDTMVQAKEAGLLNSLNVAMFAKKVDKFSEKMGLELNNQEAGLQSYSDNQEAGLESVMDSVKKGIQAIFAFIDRAIANIDKFFADIFTKIITSTGKIESKLKKIDEKLKEGNSNILNIHSDKYVKFAESSTAILSVTGLIKGGWDNPKVFFDALGKVLECMSDSKLPAVEKQEDGTLGFKITEPTHIEQYFIKEYMKMTGKEGLFSNIFDDIDKKFGHIPAESRIISIKADAVEFAHYIKNGRIMRKADGMKLNLTKTANGIMDVLTLEVSLVDKLTKQISDAIKAIKTVRVENDKRINELKKYSKEVLKKFDSEDAWKDEVSEYDKERVEKAGDGKMTHRFNQLTKETMNIWNIYPGIGNSTIVNLHFNINRTTNFLESIINGKAESETNSNSNTNNGQKLLK